MSVDHYENFPVGSWLLPRHLRRAVHAIYRVARYADDVADEGALTAQERLAQLAQIEADLTAIQRGEAPILPVMQALAPVVDDYALPLECFFQLISAFRQDVLKTRYESFAELVEYCRRSANPIGRLMLWLYSEHDARSLAMSDGICTALQLINFLQDIAVDWQKGRVYLPLQDMARFGVTEQQIAAGDTGAGWKPLMRQQVERARRLLQAGAPLARRLPGRFGLEVKLIVLGGDRILKKLHDTGGEVFRVRPVMTWKDWCYIGWRTVFA